LNDQLQRPIVRSLFDLIRFRNSHPAFAGDFNLLPSGDQSIQIEWRRETEWARLNVDLEIMSASIAHSMAGVQQEIAITSGAALEARR